MRPLRAAVVLAALAAAAAAAAYVRSTSEAAPFAPLSWATSAVAYHVNPAHPYGAPSCRPAAGADPTLAAVRASFEAWHRSCSGLRFAYAGAIDELRTGYAGGTGGENLVVFRQGWCSTIPEARDCMADPEVDCGGIYNCFEDHSDSDRSVLALTSVLYYPDSGRIVDADVEVNGWDGLGAGTAISPAQHGWYFTCLDPAGTPPCDEYGQAGCHYIDLQNTLTHEVGHVLGLRHVCDAGSGGADGDLEPCDASYAEITMYPTTGAGDVSKRSLHEDDVAGVCAIYPERDSGGCGSAGGGGGPLGAAALAAAVALRRRRRQVTTRPA